MFRWHWSLSALVIPPPLGLVFVLVGVAGRSIGSLVSKSNHSIHWSVAVSALVIPPVGVGVCLGWGGGVCWSEHRTSGKHSTRHSLVRRGVSVGDTPIWVVVCLGWDGAVCWSGHRTSSQHSTRHWSVAVSAWFGCRGLLVMASDVGSAFDTALVHRGVRCFSQ